MSTEEARLERTVDNEHERYEVWRSPQVNSSVIIPVDVAEAVREPYVVAIRAMFDQSGCDCDSAWIAERGMDGEWPAPYHASDCPVYERWEPFEGRLRALIEDRPGDGE